MRVFVRASIEVVYTYKYLSRYLIKFIKDFKFFLHFKIYFNKLWGKVC